MRQLPTRDQMTQKFIIIGHDRYQRYQDYNLVRQSMIIRRNQAMGLIIRRHQEFVD